ncbi:Suppressor of fused protein (SUFU) [compost metagenome]
MNIGQPWLDNSKCDYGFISLPYLAGSKLGIFEYDGEEIGCYWLIPITEKERDFKIEYGVEQLEQLFEDKQLDYLNPERSCLVEE